MSVQQLPHGVVKQISSAQVINSISSAVKELLENALDAGASIVDIKLERSGLDRIEIRDNGAGISATDINYVCLPHCTSKIRNFDDLERLETYGFRGEALYSLCAVSQLSITTKTGADKVASTYIFDSNGTVRDVKPSHQMNGTVITALNLFKNVPVRRQFYESTRKATEELKKIENIVKHLSIIHTKLRVTLAHNKCLIWHKTSVCSLRQSLIQVYPSAVLKNMVDVNRSFENMSIEMLIAKRDCNLAVLLQPTNEAILLYINQRPVKDKKIEKVILEEMVHLYASTLPVNKCPLTLLSLRLSPETLDVNLEPNKTKIFIRNHEEILVKVRETIMRHFYEPPPATDDTRYLPLEEEELQNAFKKPRLLEDESSAVTGDLDVSQMMRTAIIEKSNVGGEAAMEELNSSVNLSILSMPTNSLSTSVTVNGKFDDTFKLQEYDSCASSNRVALKSTFNVKNIETSRLPDGNGLKNSINLDNDLFDDKLSSNEQVIIKPSCLLNGNKTLKSWCTSAPREDRPTVTCNLENNDPEQRRSNNYEQFVSVICDENCGEEKKTAKMPDDDVSLSQWSKGLVTTSDVPLKGGVILFGNSNCSDRTTSITTKKELEKNGDKSGTLANALSLFDNTESEDRSCTVSSEIEGENTTGFTNFARRLRSEMIKDKQGVSFTNVTRELASHRSKLRNDEKKSSIEDFVKLKRKSDSDQCKPKETFKRKTLALTITSSAIIEKLKIPELVLCRRLKENAITLIGSLESDAKWLYKFNYDVSVVDVNHLQENVLLHRYICNSSVPTEQLKKPIEISSQTIGEQLWNFVSTLDRTDDDDDESALIISDRRITKNGFKVIIRKGKHLEHGDSSKLLITQVPKEMDANAFANFVKTLKLALQFEELEHCRCEAIKTILLNKVTEVCEQKTARKEAPEIRMLLQYWIQCMLQKKICSHHEPISINLHKL